MEYINKVTLAGMVGSVRESNMADGTILIRFSLCTQEVIPSMTTETVLVNWHNVTFWKKKDSDQVIPVRGDSVKVEGKLRNSRYTANDGQERYLTEIVADTLSIIKEND